ncbi:MAG TPA: M28 family metallopeptidase [Opitutaceae bacterium]|nr:M28 family metallopeptidase [Opitutaceae bacterium]
MRFPPSLVLAALGLVSPVWAQSPAPAANRDPQIESIVRQISAANIEANIRQLVAFKTRHTLSTTSDPKFGIGAARNWIKSELDRYSRESGGRLVVTFDAFHQPPAPRVPDGVEIVNVVATLPGTQPQAKNRIYVVSGHYDSICRNFMDPTDPAPGADDDGSGTAAVMEMARVMSQYRFDATLVFMTVAGEEQGLYGSTHWAQEAKRQGLNVAGMFTNDIIGNTLHEDGTRDRSHVRLFAEGVTVPRDGQLSPDVAAQIRTGGENDFPTRQLARLIQTVGARYVPQLPVEIIYRRDRYLRGGDHSPFLDEGYPAVRFTEPYEVFSRQHQNVVFENGIHYGDTVEYVDFAYAADVARVNAAALAELALAPATPHDVALETAKLENDTSLRWSPNDEPDLAGYRIVWRDTTAPQWQHAIDVPKDRTEFTVKGVSKDNEIFGLETFDTQGHASPAVYPRPRRD